MRKQSVNLESPFVHRFVRHYQVDEDDLKKFHEIACREVHCAAGDDILKRGEKLTQVIFLMSGWVMRSRYTRDGNRQIMHILLPSDIVTPGVFVTTHSDHHICAITDSIIRLVEPTVMQQFFTDTRSVAAAFWWASQQEQGILREQIVRLGRRSAVHRIAHLFLELYQRLFLAGLVDSANFTIPLKQNDIADVLGLSNVHVNRMLRRLVGLGYIDYNGTQVSIQDLDGLASFCDFDLSHLHLDSTLATAEKRGAV